jgi:hypothetical protein
MSTFEPHGLRPVVVAGRGQIENTHFSADTAPGRQKQTTARGNGALLGSVA